jgi:hypothetical protein
LPFSLTLCFLSSFHTVLSSSRNYMAHEWHTMAHDIPFLYSKSP